MRKPLYAVSVLIGLIWAVPSWGMTYVRVSDPDLLDQTTLVVVGKVLSVKPSAVTGRPFTDYEIEVERTLKGSAPGSPITVRVLGGMGPDGIGLHIWGAPEFKAGEGGLFFLESHPDGTLRIMQFMLGVFHEVTIDGWRLAVRYLPEEDGSFSSDNTVEVRDLDRFASWLSDRALGIERDPDYFVTVPAEKFGQAMMRLKAQYTLFTVSGLAVRWFVFDSAGSVPWRAHQNGQPGLLGGGFSEFQQALATWTSEPNTPSNYTYAGTTTATGGLQTFDGVNAIVFADPNNEIAGSFNCASGGTLALGGFWYSGMGPFKGQTFRTIIGGDVITQDGIDCYFAASSNPSKTAEEIFSHELGHSLGLNHSCDENGSTTPPSCSTSPVFDEALMRWIVHNDGRGAALNSDDVAGVIYLYVNAETSAKFRIERSTGHVRADGSYNCGLSGGTGGNPPCFNSGTGADLAEGIYVSEAVEPGDLVEPDPNNPKTYRKVREPYSAHVAGVISHAPA